MSIAGEAVADDLGIDGRATRLGVLEFFEHHHAGTLAHDEAVTVDVPRARAPLGRVVELGRQRAREIGRAHVWTPVTNAHLVCRPLLEKKNISVSNRIPTKLHNIYKYD